MSILDKLFGGEKNVEKAAKRMLSGLLNETDANPLHNNSPRHESAPREENSRPALAPRHDSALAGDSWGEYMPAEENQYNFGGPFDAYFERIFKEDFPGYSFEKSYMGSGRTRIVYTFSRGGGIALVVELMSERCSVKRTRRDCESTGTPYLRFYYDHDGWWNTRSYVVRRIRKYLG